MVEEERLLERDISELEDKKVELASRLGELASKYCSFGACARDSAMEIVEDRIRAVQTHETALERAIQAIQHP